jgi:tetratricopeptide (TPR) repeat protein
MRRLFRFAAALVLLSMMGSAFADPESQFDEGLRLYRSNDMNGAIVAWENVVQRGVVSGPLLYNLGNAYYRSGKVGKSILCYERARRLTPRDHDISNNLDLARLAVVDKIDSPLRLVLWNWIDSVRDYLGLNELAKLFLTVGFLFAGLLAAWRFGPLRLRTAARRAAITAAFLYVVVGSWYLWRADLDTRSFGIVMATKTDVFSAPDSAAKQLFSLHEGTKVRCGESLSGWVNVRLADGRRGWISISDMERI